MGASHQRERSKRKLFLVMWVTSLRESRAFPAFCFAVAAVALVVMVDTAPVDVVQEAVQRHVGTVPYDGDELLMQLMQVKTDTVKEGIIAKKKALEAEEIEEELGNTS